MKHVFSRVDLSNFINTYGLKIIILATFFMLLWSGWHHDLAKTYIVNASDQTVFSLGLVEGLRLAAQSVSSSSIPFLSGLFEGMASTLSSSQKYLETATSLLLFQLAVLQVSGSFLFKVALTCVLLIFLIPGARKKLKPVVITGFFINPGLPLFVIVVMGLTHELRQGLEIEPHQRLKELHEDFYRKARSEAGMKTGDFNQARSWENELLLDVDKVGDNLKQKFSLRSVAMKKVSKRTLHIALQVFISHFVTFFVLPFLYIYLWKILVFSLYINAKRGD